MPVVPVFGGVRFQTVDTNEVAQRLVDLAFGQPAGLVPDLGGPEIMLMADMVRDYLQATGRGRWLLPIRMPGRAYRAYRERRQSDSGSGRGKRTGADFLREKTSTSAEHVDQHA